MRLTLKHVAAIILVLRFATPVVAGPLEDADAAIRRRDYATALRLIRPLAEQRGASAQYILGVLYDNGLGVQQENTSTTSDSACQNSGPRPIADKP